MSYNFPAQMGSGTVPYTYNIIASVLGGSLSGVTPNAGTGQGKGERIGTQVVLANPEEIFSSPAFACSGITVGPTAVEIWAPGIHEPVLRRRRNIKIQNLGLGDVYIGHTNKVSASLTGNLEPGIKLVPSAASGITTLDIPIMGGASVWGIASNASADIRVLIY